jgi:hypothetical protein
MTSPMTLEIGSKDLVTAEVVSYLPGVKRPSRDTLVITGDWF